MDSWDACGVPIDPDELEGRPCYGGLDLASTTDITAFSLLFPDDDGGYGLLNWFWVPEESIALRSRRDRVKYDVWAREGFLETTEGNVCDYDVVREKIREFSERYQIKEIAYDRWNASQLVTQLQNDGATMVAVGLGFASMSSPTKEFEKLVISRKLRHGNHPAMRWMISNVSVKQDPAGNCKPDRAKSTEKIDGVVSALLALSRAIVQPEEFTSIYEKRGVVFV